MWPCFENSQVLYKDEISLANTIHIPDFLKGTISPWFLKGTTHAACLRFQPPTRLPSQHGQWLVICSLTPPRVPFRYSSIHYFICPPLLLSLAPGTGYLGLFAVPGAQVSSATFLPLLKICLWSGMSFPRKPDGPTLPILQQPAQRILPHDSA